MLTDDSTEEDGGGESRESLFAELGRAGCGAGADGSDGEDGESDEAVLASSMAWEPDPVDADPTQSTRSRRILDVISMLVGIYGSKELFINEYRFAPAASCSQGFASLSRTWNSCYAALLCASLHWLSGPTSCHCGAQGCPGGF